MFLGTFSGSTTPTIPPETQKAIYVVLRPSPRGMGNGEWGMGNRKWE